MTLSLATAKHGVVGNSTINNMTVRPGNNVLPMTATLNQLLVTDSMDVKTGLVELQIEALSSIRNGLHLTYYVRPLPILVRRGCRHRWCDVMLMAYRKRR